MFISPDYYMFGCKCSFMKNRVALCYVLLASIFAACNNSANNQHPSTKYEEKKATLEQMEIDSPLKFLKVRGDFHRNFVNKTVVEGEVVNNATLVSYKNMQLVIAFRDEKGSVIEKKKELLEDVIKPNSTQAFKIKTGHIKGVESITVDIVAAVAEK